MRFDGQVWFRFSDREVWDFYRFVRELASNGAQVALEWTPLPSEGEELAMATFEALDTPTRRGRFLHAMLGAVHLEGQSAGSPDAVAAAAAAADVPVAPTSAWPARRGELAKEAADLGVVDVPSMYRHGPVMRVVVNGAALTGDVVRRAETILAALDDDGLWELSKS